MSNLIKTICEQAGFAAINKSDDYRQSCLTAAASNNAARSAAASNNAAWSAAASNNAARSAAAAPTRNATAASSGITAPARNAAASSGITAPTRNAAAAVAITTVICLLLAMFMLFGCAPVNDVADASSAGSASAQPAASESTSTLPETSIEAIIRESPDLPSQLPGQHLPVSDASGFNDLGLRMLIPAGIEENYGKLDKSDFYLIENHIGEIAFSLNGSSFFYRGSADTADLSRISMTFMPVSDEITTVSRGDETVPISIERTDGGYMRATWSWSEGNYCLIANGDVPPQAFSDIAMTLAQAG
jgi:hypothetical protein